MPIHFLLLAILFSLPQEASPIDLPKSEQADGEWMRFRGPNGAGIASAKQALPASFEPQGHLRWKSPTPPGHSSPIVVGDAIFVTGFEPGKLSTHCFDRGTGGLRWRRDVQIDAFEKFHPQHGPASPTPTSDGQHLFVVFGSFGIVAYDLSGTELWRHATAARRNMFGSASSPIIADGKLIVLAGCEDESLLQAFDPPSGTLLWERRRPGPASSWSTPVLWNSGAQAALLIYEPFTLRACSLKDGEDLWSVPGLADEPITTPQVSSDLIFTSSYNLRTNREATGLPTFDALLKECDADGNGSINSDEAKTNKSILSRPDADGQGDHPLRMFFRMLDEDSDGSIQSDEWPRIHSWMEPWTHANGLIALRPGDTGTSPTLEWQYEVGVPECPTPIIWEGRLYAVRNGGVVTCLNAASGELLFQERLAAAGPYYASPVAGDGKIYLASARGTITVFSAEPKPRVLATRELGESISATPAIVDNQIIVRTEKHLWLFATPTNGSDSK